MTTKTKFSLIVLIGIILGAIFTLLLVTHKPKIQTLQYVQSDVLATNIKFPNPDDGGDSLRYFGGSVVSRLSLDKPQTSEKLSAVVPTNNINDVRWIASGALLNLNQLAKNDYLLSIDKNPEYTSRASWWKLSAAKLQPYTLPGIPTTNIKDILISTDHTIQVMYNAPATMDNTLYVFNDAPVPVLQYHNDHIFKAATIVGGNSNTSYVRESTGTIYKVTKDSVDKIIDTSLDASWDDYTSTIVYTTNSKSQNGSSLSKDSNRTDDHKGSPLVDVKTYNTDYDKPKIIIKTITGKPQIHNGLALLFDKKTNILHQYELASGKTTQFKIQPSKQSMAKIVSIIPGTSKEAGKIFWAFDTTHNMYVLHAGAAKQYITSLPVAKVIKTNQRTAYFSKGNIHYDLVLNQATVIYNYATKPPTLDELQKIVPELEKPLGDLGQVKLQWVVQRAEYDEEI